MAIQLTEHDREKIEQHAVETYPNECCGLLLGGGGLVSHVVVLSAGRN